MCLLLFAKSGRPTEDAIRNSASSNRDGIGYAFKKDGILHYEKGITIEKAIELSKTLPLGFCMHFRMASIGGVSKDLIHPFDVRLDVPLKQKGKSNRLLFHNGHFSDWKEVLLKHLTERFKLPEGQWSDTRALAMLAAMHGRQFLNLITGFNKFAFMTPTKVHLIGTGWIEDNGVWYSNSGYSRGSYFSGGHYSDSYQHGDYAPRSVQVDIMPHEWADNIIR